MERKQIFIIRGDWEEQLYEVAFRVAEEERTRIQYSLPPRPGAEGMYRLEIKYKRPLSQSAVDTQP